MQELWQMIDGFFGKWWWGILIALALTILLFVIVVKAKNARIRKLKKQLRLTRTELETSRTRDSVVVGSGKTVTKTAPQAGTAATRPSAARTIDEPDSYGSVGATTEPFDRTMRIETVTDDDPVSDEIIRPDPDEDELPALEYYDKPVQVAHGTENIKFIVVYDRAKDSWVIKKDGATRATRRVDTKEEAMQIARELVRKYNAKLVVHKKDGKFQKHF